MPPPTSQNLFELIELLSIYKQREPKRVLEIGTHEGGTLFYWVKEAVDGAVIGSIDDQGIISTGKADQWASENVSVECLKADSSSSEAILWAYNNFGWVDWLFIDGGHSYEQVKSDWDNYFPLVIPGGAIVLHDILPQNGYEEQPCEVDKLWSEIKENYAGVQEIVEPHPEWGFGPGIGIVYL